MNDLTLLEKLTDKFELILGYEIGEKVYENKTNPCIIVKVTNDIDINIIFSQDKNSINRIEIVDTVDNDFNAYSIKDSGMIMIRLHAIKMVLNELDIREVELIQQRQVVEHVVMKNDFLLVRPKSNNNKED